MGRAGGGRPSPMARINELGAANEALTRDLSRSFQSAHINFMLGSGASYPAVPLAGQVEREIEALRQDGDGEGATRRMYELLSSVQAPSNRLAGGAPNKNEASVLGLYQTFFRSSRTS